MEQAHQIPVYSTQTCGFCRMAMAYFDSLGIKYTDIDVTLDVAKQKEMIEKSGQMGVPVIIIDGTVIVGFDKPKIDQLLNTPVSPPLA